jgi:hypothetical protein
MNDFVRLNRSEAQSHRRNLLCANARGVILMMYEIKMPVTVYRGDLCIGSGDLLPNGANLALCVDENDGEGLQLFQYYVDTKIVEEKIPMTFYCEGQEVAEGDLVQTGDYICLCPHADTSFDLMDPKGSAELWLQPDGSNARLNIKRKN